MRTVKPFGVARTAALIGSLLAGAGPGLAAEPGAPAPSPTETLPDLHVCADPGNLPYSNERGEGFENAIADLLARDLQVDLHYTWNQQRRSFLRRTLQAGRCNVVIGAPVGLPGVRTTRPYYQASYVLVARRGPGAPRALDELASAPGSIGLHAVGAEGVNTPVAQAVSLRGLSARVAGFSPWGTEDDDRPLGHLVQAVADGQVGAALVWGPVAGFFARQSAVPLNLAPVLSDPLQPQQVFRFDIAVGVRRGDEHLLAALQQALDRRAQEVRQILDRYGVPHVDGAVLGPPPAPGPAL